MLQRPEAGKPPLTSSSSKTKQLAKQLDQGRKAEIRFIEELKEKEADAPDTSRKMTYPLIQPSGLYSEMVCSGVEEVLLTKEMVMVGPSKLHSLQWAVPTEKHTPKTTAFYIPKQAGTDELKKQVTAVSKKAETDFLAKAFIPKIQMAYEVNSGECPRKLAIERTKRVYESKPIDVVLLDEYHLRTDDLMPKNPMADSTVRLNHDPDNPAPFPIFLPLHIFDDEDMDCRLPEEWLKLGWDEEKLIQMPVPGKALIPIRDEDFDKNPTDPSIIYRWCNVGVLDYDPEEKLWLVQRCTRDHRVLDSRGEPVRNFGVFDGEGNRVMLPSQIWLPRIRVVFRAEDPVKFGKRIDGACLRRWQAEAELRYNLYVDCMPMDGIEDLTEASWKRIEKWTLSTPGIRRHPELVDALMKRLEEEVKIDYKRSMNRQTLGVVVEKYPETFAYVTLPKKFEWPVPQTARYHDVPDYPFEEQRAKLVFKYTMTPHAETIASMVKIRNECNRVAQNMSLFYLPTPKPMKIEDFEQSQANASTQTSLFLKDSWIATIRAHIRGTMVTVGKGWYDIHQPRFHIYQQSPFKVYMETIKFMMQDSLRFLVQDSLITFTQLIMDACHTMVALDETYSWGRDLINSPFRPKRIALFVMELVMDSQTVAFSTKLERFEECLMTLFDKAIMATNSVPQMERVRACVRVPCRCGGMGRSFAK